MAEIILVRHGQASFDTGNYDRLSKLGWSQALWLGEHLKQLDRECDRVVMGEMARHRDTADGILEGLQSDLIPEVHSGLNEYDFQGLLTPLRERFADVWADTGHARRDYYYNMKRALGYWTDGTIPTDGRDSWSGFRERIDAALKFVCEGRYKRVLVITSGGPISVILGRVLNLDNERICNITVQIKNSSTTTLLYDRVNLNLDNFNDVSHLQIAERLKYITFT